MRRAPFVLMAAAMLVGAIAGQNIQDRVLFGSVGGNDAFITLEGTASSGTPVLNFQFTTSDTTEYVMDPSTFSLGTNTLTANSTVYTFPSATSAAVNVGEYEISMPFGGTAADHVDTQFYIATGAVTVTEIDAVWGVAESTGSMDIMVERLQGTEACGSGDDLLSAAIDGTTTANTVNNGALTATTANLSLAAGNRLCVDLTATPNEITNLVVTVRLTPN